MTGMFPNPEDLARTAEIVNAAKEHETVDALTHYDLLFLYSAGVRPEVLRQNALGMVYEVRL